MFLSTIEREQFQSDIFGKIIKICKGQESVTRVLHWYFHHKWHKM